MPERAIHTCQCPDCLPLADHPNRTWHQQMNLLLSRLDEQQRRWYAAVEAQKAGHGGIRLFSQITGLDEKTIVRGQPERAEQLNPRPSDRIRLPGAGGIPAEKKTSL